MKRRKHTAKFQNHTNFDRMQVVNARLGEVDREFQYLHRHLDQIRQERNDPVPSDQDHYSTHFAESFNSLHEQLQALDFNTNQTINAQSDNIRIQLEDLESEVWGRTTNQLEEQIEWLEGTFAGEHAYQLSTINQLQESLANLQLDSLRHQEIAWQFLGIAQETYRVLNEQYINESAWQAESTSLLYKLNQSQANFDNGFVEAALAGSQEVYQRLLEIHTFLDDYIHRRLSAITTTQDFANEVFEVIIHNQHVQAINLQGELLQAELEVNYWSNGQIQFLLRQVKSILHQLQSSPYTLEMEEISNSAERLVSIREQIPIIVQGARFQVLSSQLRFSIAECVLAALRTQGYEISFGGFSENDKRNPYQLSMGNLAGSQVFVTISQIHQQPFSHNLELETSDQEALSEYEQRQRGREIDSALGVFGLKVGLNNGPDSVFYPVERANHSSTFLNRMQISSPKPARIDAQSLIG